MKHAMLIGARLLALQCTRASPNAIMEITALRVTVVLITDKLLMLWESQDWQPEFNFQV